VGNRTLEIPSIGEIADRLMPAEVAFQVGDQRLRRPLREWVTADRAEARERREKADVHSIFVRVAAALLERNVTGGSYFSRLRVLGDLLCDPKSLTEPDAETMLRMSGYRFPSNGAKTLVAICQHFASSGFSWPTYLAEAEAKWEDGFTEDPLFRIKGIGNKVRDFALSEFSDYYCAPDLHVCRMMARTGLILHGYGDPGFSTVDYGFVRRVIQKLAKDTGFPGGPDALSPAHIDRMFWYYGQDRARCDAKPDCDECPANAICLTGARRGHIAARTGKGNFEGEKTA